MNARVALFVVAYWCLALGIAFVVQMAVRQEWAIAGLVLLPMVPIGYLVYRLMEDVP